MTDAEIFDIALKHAAYRDSAVIVVRGQALVEFAREVLAKDAEGRTQDKGDAANETAKER